MLSSYILATHNCPPTTFANCSFGKHIKVTGILYLHNLSDNRLTEPLPHYEIFKKLCGIQYPANVVLVLTMCEKVKDEMSKEREEFLKNHWRKRMGKKGVVFCHHGTKKSAWDAVTALGVKLTTPTSPGKNGNIEGQ